MAPRPPDAGPAFLDAGPDTDFDDARPGGGRPRPPHRGSSPLPWLLTGIVLAAAGAATVVVYLPMRERLRHAESALGEASGNVVSLQKQVAALVATQEALQTARENLAHEVESKAQDLDALQRTEEELAQRFAAQMGAGELAVHRSHAGLVVDLVDKVLFDSGEASLHAAGKKLLAQVAESLNKLSDRRIEVRGHTDTLPIAARLRGRYPTNWELSSERATQVVRFLQESCGIAGKRLRAAGYAEFEPTASNASPAGRARNRRIELVLVPLASRGEGEAE